MTEVTWGKPPAAANGGRSQREGAERHRELAQQLKDNPGEWAHVATKRTAHLAGSHAYDIRNANLAAYRPAGSFEAVARTVDAEHRVYARYVGEV
jgi:hypothetical protein